MKHITIMDTSIATRNLGDQIIMDSVNRHVKEIFYEDMILHVPTHDKIGKISVDIIKNSEITLVGGTNILNGKRVPFKKSAWSITLLDTLKVKDLILMGTGWGAYQENTNLYSKLLYKGLLNKKYIHSVRDSYTEKKLKSLGFENVINTGCPTMWNLTKEHCRNIPKQKAKSVVCTFTDYSKDYKNDKKLAEILHNNYDKVYCWIQGSNDLQYVNTLSNKFIIVPPSLAKYDELLDNNEIDYIGTRLHAGIRALQKKRRSIIVSIDNRAKEMGADFDLPIIERNEIDNLENVINNKLEININLNYDAINKWKEQFKK